MLEKIGVLLQGKKSYIIVAIAIALTSYQLITGNIVPDYVYTILAAAGLGAVRSAINKVK